MNSNDIILSLHPREVTVAEVRKLLAKTDDDTRQTLADLVLHRLRNRYITPLEKVPHEYRSGFLTMAACCLLIETLQCFKDGKEDTRGVGEATFKQFFSDYTSEFSGIDGGEFYRKIRCGILHQAQTHGSFRIWLEDGAIYDSEKKIINATKFMEALKAIVEEYVDTLRSRDMSVVPWPNALLKIKYICDAAEND
jgi:hypothetical protein